MSVVETDLKWYGTTDIPNNDTDAGGGAIDTGNQIVDGQQGKTFGTIRANALAGADKVRYGKQHILNDHATDDLINGVVWMNNMLLDHIATGVLAITTVAAGDDDTKYERIFGRDSVGTPVYEDVTLPATPGTVYSTTQWLHPGGGGVPLRCELRLVADDSLQVAEGDITFVIAALTLGKIPGPFGTNPGRSTARGDIEIGLAATLDDTTAIANRTTAPAGVVFTRTNAEDIALAVANAGVLTAQTDQAVWVKWTLSDGDLTTPNLELDILIDGDTA